MERVSNENQHLRCVRKSPQTTRRRKRPTGILHGRISTSFSWSATALSLILAMQGQGQISKGITVASAFVPSPILHGKVSPTSTSTSSTQSHFRTSVHFRYADEEEDSSGINMNSSHSHTHRSPSSRRMNSATNASASTSTGAPTMEHSYDIETMYSMNMPLPAPTNDSINNLEGMPSWLRPSGFMAEGKLSALREIMRNPDSYLSHVEAEQVISAIREASHGNLDMISGAVDFCLVLVETMEMGLATLIAAAYHYCDAYEARQHSALKPTDFSHTEYWNKYGGEGETNVGGDRAIKIGQDADQIIKDAATIKRAEMVASASLKSKFRPSASESASICKMLLSETHDWRALAIRSAACLYRLRGIFENFEDNNAGTAGRYTPSDIRVAREALQIHAPLASRLGMHRLKNEIEGAAFRILYRRQFEKVTELTHLNKPCNPESENCVVSSIKDGMRVVLDTVTEDISKILMKDPCYSKYVESHTVTARIKEPYSLWRKMLKLKAKSILDVPDALALRVVFKGKKMKLDEDEEVIRARETALCYYIQQICVNNFRPTSEGRFKDYVANPKPNGYQSLHYTAIADKEGDEWPFEIQIRSSDMHQVAEFGLAAHWDYKAQGGQETASAQHYAFKLDNCSEAYLRSVQEWHWERAQARGAWNTDSNSERTDRQRARDEHLAPYLDALMKDQSNLAREQVFIFMSCNDDEAGQILELPAGACILDALRESERTFGFTSNRSIENGIIYNGSQSSVTQQLSNGDIISIPINADSFSPQI
jgi:ppGpp synthetase/RelA/SpoT-type nucleotidyltranferase